MEGKSGGWRKMTRTAINVEGSWGEAGMWLDWDRGRSLSQTHGGWCVALLAAFQVSRHRSNYAVT